MEEREVPNSFPLNRTQFYRKQKTIQLKQKSIPMSRQQFNCHQNYTYFRQRKNWFNYFKSGYRSTIMNKISEISPKTNFLRNTLTAPVKQNPDIKRIVDAYMTTLGRQANQYDTHELIPIHFDANQTLSQRYSSYIEEVNQFVQRLDILSTLPEHEVNENMKNWLNVMLLRSCWWYTFTDEEDMDVIRINNNCCLFRDQNRRLEPLFAFAQTISEMNLNSIELSLVSTYQLLMGATTFLPDPNTNEMTATAKSRDLVLKLLYNYEQETYPDINCRYARLLTSLSELTYISIKN